MTIAFVLGSNPQLSVAEIRAALANRSISHQMQQISNSICLVKTEGDEKSFPQPQQLLNTLGGTVKIIEVFWQSPVIGGNKVNFLQKNLAAITAPLLAMKSKKITVGTSAYGHGFSVDEMRAVGMSIKNELRAHSRSVRFVRAQKKTSLDAGSINKNRLLEEGGAELCFFVDKGLLFCGITRGIQDIDFYTLRDVGRPRRNMKIGMLPPKLAQILLNLAGAKPGARILDPFCGVGTVLQEGMLADYNMTGSDRDPYAIELAQKNADWFVTTALERIKRTVNPPRLSQSDARDVGKTFQKHYFDAIATESTLGPALETFPSDTQIAQLRSTLEPLIGRSLQAFLEVLKPGARIAITFPFYQDKQGKRAFVMSDGFIDKVRALGYDVVQYLRPEQATPRNSLLYAREDQVVGREIFVFQARSRATSAR